MKAQWCEGLLRRGEKVGCQMIVVGFAGEENDVDQSNCFRCCTLLIMAATTPKKVSGTNLGGFNQSPAPLDRFFLIISLSI